MLPQTLALSSCLLMTLAIAGCGEAAMTSSAPAEAAAPPEAAAEQADGGWSTNAAQTLAAAKQEGKLVLADFTGSDWCGWCIKLDAEVFSTPRFREWAAGRAKLLLIDFPRGKAQSDALKAQNERLQEKYGIRGFPTVHILDADGKSLGQLGYVPGGPDAWIQKAEAIMKRSER